MKNNSRLIRSILTLVALAFLLIAQTLLAGPLRASLPAWTSPSIQRLKPTQIGIPLLITGCFLILTCFPYIKKIESPKSRFSRRITFFLLSLLLLLSIPIRAYKLSQTPLGAYNDEIIKGMQALKILDGYPFQPFFYGNKEFLFFYFLIPFIRLLGPTIFALRALPFLCGIITVFFSWLLFDRLWNRTVAFVGSGFLAVGLWPGQSSHICERLNAVPMFTAATLYFLMAAIQSKRVWAWVATGVIMAGGMWTFPSYRLIPAGVMLFIIWSLISKQLSFKRDFTRILLLFLVFVICLSAPFKWNPEATFSAFYSRQEHDFKIIRTADQAGKHARQLLVSFTVDAQEDMSFTSQTRPLLWWPLGAFFLAGLIVALIRLPRSSSVLVVLWLLVALVPAVASEPFARRLTAAQPLVFGLTGLGSQVLFEIIFPFLKRYKVLIPSGLLILVTGKINFDYFRHTIAPVWSVAHEDFRMVQTAIELSERFDVFMDKVEEEAELPYRFLTYPQTKNLNHHQLYPPTFSIPFRFEPNRDFIYLFRNISVNTRMIPVLTALYPEGELVLNQTETSPRGFYRFSMSRQALAARRGIQLSIAAADTDKQQIAGGVRQFSRQNFTFDSQDIGALAGSMDGTQNWTVSGVFLADTLGQHDFLFQGPKASSFYIDNIRLRPSDTFIPDRGILYSVFLTAEPHLITTEFNVLPAQAPTSVALSVRRVPKPQTPDNLDLIPSNLWLQPPVSDQIGDPIPVHKADFQYAFSKNKHLFRPATSRVYDIARIEALPDGRYIANCWYNRCMVLLDTQAEVIDEWDANLLHDPDWQRRFDFDVAPDGTIYLAGDSRKTLIVATSSGGLLQTIPLPDVCRSIHIESPESALILCPHALYRIALPAGAILAGIHPGQITYDRIETMTTDHKGRIYLADIYFNVIHVLSAEGLFLRSFRIPGPLADTFGLRFDSNGYLYIPHFGLDYVACFSSDGILQTGAPSHGCDPLDSRRTRIPRYIFFPDADSAWITNADSIFIMDRVR